MPRVVRKSSKRTQAIIMKRVRKSPASSTSGRQPQENLVDQTGAASSIQPNVGEEIVDLGQADHLPFSNLGLSLSTEANHPDHENKKHPRAPALFTSHPPIRDDLETETSILQYKTIDECLPFLGTEDDGGITDFNVHRLARLKRDLHIEYLEDSLGDYSSAYLAYDASRPWLVYWALLGLSLLGEDVTSYRDRSAISILLRGLG